MTEPRTELEQRIRQCGADELTAIVASIKLATGRHALQGSVLTAAERLSESQARWVLDRVDRQRPMLWAAQQARREEEQRAAEAAEQVRRAAEAARRAAEPAERLRREREARARRRCWHALSTDFLSAQAAFDCDPDAGDLPTGWFENLKAEFVRDWSRREVGIKLDLEQAGGVAAVAGNTLVVARAGSGKTRVLVTRALFLQMHCRVSPREMLLVAFNREAVDEIKARLKKHLGDDLPHVMTFHALAYAVVHPEEELLYDNTDADQLGLSRAIQGVIDEHCRADTPSGSAIRELMFAYFREDWEEIVRANLHLQMDEFLAYRRSLVSESLKGGYVKSFGEKVIANTLFEHDIDYVYERAHGWDENTYRPDFTIPGSDGRPGVIIEYFGMEGDPDYDRQSAAKREFWDQKKGWRLLDYAPHHVRSLGPDGFARRLLDDLAGLGWHGVRLDEEEIWQRISGRAIGRFTGAMTSFVSRCRKRNLAADCLGHIAAAHETDSDAERRFLAIAQSVYRDYLRRLSTEGQEDFDGLVWRASERIREGQTSFVRDKGREHGDLARLRFVMIDEFQDFSEMFFELVRAVQYLNPKLRVFCVGDDWQAINGFAGSELRFFTDFAEHSPEAQVCSVSTNYRSARSIVDVGNAVMRGIGTEARADREEPGTASLFSLTEFRHHPVEADRHKHDDIITPALLRIITKVLAESQRRIVLLARRNEIPWRVNLKGGTGRGVSHNAFLEHMRRFIDEADRERITISTAHRYKGRQEDVVILIDAIAGSFPLIHPNGIFLRALGDSLESIEAEERRLFYVAVTRARDELVVITEDHRQSPYLADTASANGALERRSWDAFKPAPSLDGPRIVIRVSKAYDVRDILKSQGYTWDSETKEWCRALPKAAFDLDDLCQQPWLAHGVTVDVTSEDGERLHAL